MKLSDTGKQPFIHLWFIAAGAIVYGWCSRELRQRDNNKFASALCFLVLGGRSAIE
jgi:hypothetical protein